MEFPLYSWHWGLGVLCSTLKEPRFQQPNRSPDYHTVSTIKYEPLGLLMVWRLIYTGGCFPYPLKPPYLLNYDWNEILITIQIHSNMLWLLMITSNQFIDPPPHLPTSFLLSYSEEWSVLIANDWFRTVPQTFTA